MTYNEVISQLEDLKKDAQSHISDDEPSSVFKDDVEALRIAIDVLRGLNTNQNSSDVVMERCTRVLETGMIWPTHGVGEALKQLAAYENTGFTPEQIEKLKKELYLTGTYVCVPSESIDNK